MHQTAICSTEIPRMPRILRMQDANPLIQLTDLGMLSHLLDLGLSVLGLTVLHVARHTTLW